MALGDLAIGLKADTKGFIGPLQMAQKTMGGFVGSVTSGLATFGLAANGARAAFGVLESLSLPVQMAAQAEQTAISMEVMTGSAAVAGELLGDLRKMGAATPFEFGDLSKASTTLLSFGRSVGDVMTDLDMLSNVAAGDANKLGSLSVVFGQISANGRLTGGDLMQLINVGFNPLNSIAERTGETMMDLRKRMEKGGIGFEEVRQSFEDATSAGGLFYQMNEKQSETMLGKWSTLKDGINSALTEIGTAIMQELDLKEVTNQLIELAETFKKIIPPAVEAFTKIGDAIGKIHKTVKDFDEGVQALGLNTLEKLGLLKNTADEIRAAERAADADLANRNAKVAQLGGLNQDIQDRINSLTGDPVRAMMKENQGALGRTNAMIAAGQDDGKWKDNGGLIDVSSLMKENAPGAAEVKKFQAEIEGGSVGEFASKLGDVIARSARVREDTTKVGSLEKDSQEAFEVLRQNVGNKTEDKQLKEAEKQTKLLATVAKNTAQTSDAPAVAVRGID